MNNTTIRAALLSIILFSCSETGQQVKQTTSDTVACEVNSCVCSGKACELKSFNVEKTCENLKETYKTNKKDGVMTWVTLNNMANGKVTTLFSGDANPILECGKRSLIREKAYEEEQAEAASKESPTGSSDDNKNP